MTLTQSLSEAVTGPGGEPRVLVVSDCPVGAAVATDLSSEAAVRLVTDDDGVARQMRDDVSVTTGDLRSAETLRSGVGDGVDAAIVAASTDRVNLLATQLLRTRFDVEEVAVLVRDPACRDAIDDVSTATVCGTDVLAAELRTAFESTLRRTEPA